MAFIGNSVGTQGKNNPEDVLVIGELLILAHMNHRFLKPFTLRALGEEALFYSQTLQAVREFFSYAKRFSDVFPPQTNSVFRTEDTIYPDDCHYRLLLSCVACGGRPPTGNDFYQNSLLNQAAQGRISCEMFKSVAANSNCRTLTRQGLEAKRLLSDARIRAFLDMISWAGGNTGYQTGFGNRHIDNLSRHPSTVKDGSSAAGRYQFLTKDWNGAKDELGLYSNSLPSLKILPLSIYCGRGHLLITPFQARFCPATWMMLSNLRRTYGHHSPTFLTPSLTRTTIRSVFTNTKGSNSPPRSGRM